LMSPESNEVMILEISSCEAWKGWGRTIFVGLRPFRLTCGEVEDSPHKKKFPRSCICAGGFHVPCKTIIEYKSSQGFNLINVWILIFRYD
jgi:hypothetical protein